MLMDWRSLMPHPVAEKTRTKIGVDWFISMMPSFYFVWLKVKVPMIVTTNLTSCGRVVVFRFSRDCQAEWYLKLTYPLVCLCCILCSRWVTLWQWQTAGEPGDVGLQHWLWFQSRHLRSDDSTVERASWVSCVDQKNSAGEKHRTAVAWIAEGAAVQGRSLTCLDADGRRIKSKVPVTKWQTSSILWHFSPAIILTSASQPQFVKLSSTLEKRPLSCWKGISLWIRGWI